MISWLRKRKQIREAVKRDEYIERLRNSARGLCGISHFGDEPFLEIHEVRFLIRQELESATAPAPDADERED